MLFPSCSVWTYLLSQFMTKIEVRFFITVLWWNWTVHYVIKFALLSNFDKTTHFVLLMHLLRTFIWCLFIYEMKWSWMKCFDWMTKLLSCNIRMMLHLAGLLWAVCKQWIKNKIDWKANIYFEMALQKVVTMENSPCK